MDRGIYPSYALASMAVSWIGPYAVVCGASARMVIIATIVVGIVAIYLLAMHQKLTPTPKPKRKRLTPLR